MIFESIMTSETLIPVLGLAFITVICLAIIQVSYLSEQIGDEEE